jgi:hypothetical protein
VTFSLIFFPVGTMTIEVEAVPLTAHLSCSVKQSLQVKVMDDGEENDDFDVPSSFTVVEQNHQVPDDNNKLLQQYSLKKSFTQKRKEKENSVESDDEDDWEDLLNDPSRNGISKRSAAKSKRRNKKNKKNKR